MAKATKASKIAAIAPTFTLASDIEKIARDFGTFGHFTFDVDVKAALERHAGNADAFNAIRISAQGAWLTRYGYSAERGREIMDKSKTTYPDAIASKLPRRTTLEQAHYKNAGAAWSHYLEIGKIETLNTSKKRTPRPAEKTAPKADAPKADAPITPQAFVVTSAADLQHAVMDVSTIAALLTKTVSANAKVLTSEAGDIVRALAIHVAEQIKLAKKAAAIK